jgi:hypothetical protein
LTNPSEIIHNYFLYALSSLEEEIAAYLKTRICGCMDRAYSILTSAACSS